MMRSPDDVKKGLEITSSNCLMCECCVTDCPYDLECHPGNEETNTNVPKAMLHDALALIQQLQAQNAEQAERIRVLETERDAAVADLSHVKDCDTCKYDNACLTGKKDCFGCHEKSCPCLTCKYEWRGVTKEE